MFLFNVFSFTLMFEITHQTPNDYDWCLLFCLSLYLKNMFLEENSDCTNIWFKCSYPYVEKFPIGKAG